LLLSSSESETTLSQYRRLKSIPEEEEFGDSPQTLPKLTTFFLGATVPLKIETLAGGRDTIPNISDIGVNSFILPIENNRRSAS